MAKLYEFALTFLTNSGTYYSTRFFKIYYFFESMAAYFRLYIELTVVGGYETRIRKSLTKI